MRPQMTALVASASLALLLASPAAAQAQLKLDQVGAALALPLIGDQIGDSRTFLTVTNVGPADRNLHFNVIGPEWQVTDFDCPVTASETVLISWLPAGQGSYALTVECNFAGLTERVVSRVHNFDVGTLFIANETSECKDASCTTNENDLFGDFVVVTPGKATAWSGGAIPFQGIDPLAPGVADREYHFDNSEYAMFPATLVTNFIAPGLNPFYSPGHTISAELILFTLDGRANVGSQAALDIVFFDDEETPTSTHYDFDCFAIVALDDIDPNFEALNLGSGVGHVYMTTIDADQNSNVHDNKFGNGNAIRVVGVHGWLVQTVVNELEVDVEIDGEVCLTNGEICDTVAMWSRPLSQGPLPQDLDDADVPTLDGL